MKTNFFNGLKVDFNIMKYFLKVTNKISKAYLPMAVITSIFKSLVPIVNIIMPKFIIDELLGGKRIEVFIKLILITIIANAIFSIISSYLIKKVEIINLKVERGFYLLIGDKIMNMDFEKIEDPEILDLKERAIFPIQTQGVIQWSVELLVDILTSIMTIIGVLSVILTLDIYLVLFILLIVALNSLLVKKVQKFSIETQKEIIPANRGFGYYASMTMDFSIAKDVRLYNMENVLMNEVIKFTNITVEKFNKIFTVQGKYTGLNRVNTQIQMLAVYGYMTYKVFINSIGIGSFTMYISAANTFSTSISTLIKNILKLREACRYLDPYIEFEQIKSSKLKGKEKIDNIKDYNIEFKNVSFKYPRSKEYTLKDVNVKLNYGEKISVVGLNGAGKTTFIKLLSRLYEPTEGEILLNGVNIKEYSYEEYMNLFGVVFQDFKLFAFTVKENIVLDESENIDDEKIHEALRKSGLEKDILKLEKGINTNIYKTFETDGIEFSGGQAQKLAISRTMYKNAPIVILDEPTAALDPIAEFEIYSKFNELIGNKTAIYISHRLSSSKFCDRIIVFDKGKIIQYGTHDELIEAKDNQYNKMYMAQAQYYN